MVFGTGWCSENIVTIILEIPRENNCGELNFQFSFDSRINCERNKRPFHFIQFLRELSRLKSFLWKQQHHYCKHKVSFPVLIMIVCKMFDIFRNIRLNNFCVIMETNISFLQSSTIVSVIWYIPHIPVAIVFQFRIIQ